MSKGPSLVLWISVVLVCLSFVGLGITLYDISKGQSSWMTGFATNTGTANLTVSSTAAINFTTNNINWGTGSVNQGSTQGILDSSSGLTTNTTGFTSVTQGFIVENTGNVNISVKLMSGLDAAGLLGGTSPLYQFNVTNSKANSCTATLITLGAVTNVNITSPGTTICDKMRFENDKDTIKIDLRLAVPSDSKTGALSDTLTATIAQVP